MERKDRFIYITIAWGMVEIVFFCGCVFGWASLVYVYKDLGYFSNLCSNVTHLFNLTIASNSSFQGSHCLKHSCPAQDNQFSLIFTIAVVFTGAMCFLNGFMYDRFGTRFCRLYAYFVTLTGYLFLIMASTELPYLLYPGLILMSYGAYMVLLTNFQLGNLIPKYRSTIVALYCGAYDCSAVIYLLFKLAYENGFSVRNCFIIQACFFSIVLIGSFTVMPKYKYYTTDDYTFHLTFKLCRQKHDENPDIYVSKESLPHVNNKEEMVYDPYELTRSREALTAINHVPSVSSLFRPKMAIDKPHSSLMNINSLSTPIVRQALSVDNIPRSGLRTKQMVELETLLKNDSSQGSIHTANNKHDEVDCGIARSSRKYPSDLDICRKSVEEGDGATPKPAEGRQQRITFKQNFISPMYLCILVWLSVNRLRSWFFVSVFNPWISSLADSCSQVSFYTSVFAMLQFFGIVTSPLGGRLMDRKSSGKFSNPRYEQLNSSILTFAITSSLGLLLSIMSTIPVIQAQPLTFALHTFHRSFTYGPLTAFIANTFPFEHFGKLLGTSLTVSALCGLLQYPILLITQGPLDNNPLVVNIILILAMCVTYLLPCYIWRYLRGKRRKARGNPIMDNAPFHEATDKGDNSA